MTDPAVGLILTTYYTLDMASGTSDLLSANADGNVTFYLYARGRPVGETTNAWSYSLNDGLDVPRQMINANGEITLMRSYTPWGEVMQQSGMGNFTWGYFGGLMDAATGLIYIGNGQYYDPATGRFLTPANQKSTNPYLPSPFDPLGALLGPVALVAWLRGRRRGKRSKVDIWLVLLVAAAGLGIGLAACGGGGGTTPCPEPPTTSPSPTETPYPGPRPTEKPGPEPTPTTTPGPTETPTPTPTPANTNTAYLTFDDGPDPYYTQAIADALRKYTPPVLATFFVIGEDRDAGNNIINKRIEGNADLLKSLKAHGNAIGIHGWVHGDETDILHLGYLWNHHSFDVTTINTEITTLTNVGVTPDPLFRAPGGAFRPNPFSGYEGWYYYGWDVDSGDGGSGNNGVTADQIINNVAAGLSNKPDNPIILLHSTNPNTAQAISREDDNLISKLKELGYTNFLPLPRRGGVNSGGTPYPPDSPGYPPNGRIFTTGWYGG